MPHLLPQSPSSQVPDRGWKRSRQSSGILQPEASPNNLLRSRGSAWSSPQPREPGGASRGHGSTECLLGAGTRQRERRASPRGVSARLLSRARRLWVFFEGSSYPDRSQIPGCAAVGGCTASPRQAASPARGHPGPPRNNSIIFGCPKLSWRFEPRGTNPTEPTPWAFRCFACFKSRRFQALQRTMETFCWRQKAASHLRVPWLTHSLGTKTHIPRSPSLCKGITGLPRSSAHQETQSHFRKPFGINLMQTTPSARRRNAGLSMAPPEPQHHPAPGTYRSLPPSSSRLPKRRVPRG